MDISIAKLRACMPGLSAQKASIQLPFLVSAMQEAEITTPIRMAAFLAQLGHESLSLRFMEEIADGSAYEGREDLGNVHPGDGKRYKGRGPIQLTGRNNYRAAGHALGLPLEDQPKLAATNAVGFRVAGWYWTDRNLNPIADLGPPAFDRITRKINGHLKGKADRDQRYAVCRAMLTDRNVD
jgi:putative chitinase